jgi:hypothetical protein
MAAVLVLLFALSAVDAAASDQTGTPTAVVRLDNVALVPADSLDFAESRTAEIFSRIGVRVTWIDEETAFREHLRPPFTVVVINSSVQLLARPSVVDALGFADPSVSRAHVIYDRVEALRARSPRSLASLLGDVIAHELGHLMLPSAPPLRSRNHAFGLWTYIHAPSRPLRTVKRGRSSLG